LQDQIAQKEWIQSIRLAHKTSQELLGSITNKKVGKIYGTESDTAAAANRAAAVTLANATAAAATIAAKNTNGSN